MDDTKIPSRTTEEKKIIQEALKFVQRKETSFSLFGEPSSSDKSTPQGSGRDDEMDDTVKSKLVRYHENITKKFISMKLKKVWEIDDCLANFEKKGMKETYDVESTPMIERLTMENSRWEDKLAKLKEALKEESVEKIDSPGNGKSINTDEVLTSKVEEELIVEPAQK